MRHRNQTSTERYTRKPAKRGVTLKEIVASLGERVKSQRLATKAMSVNWTGK